MFDRDWWRDEAWDAGRAIRLTVASYLTPIWNVAVVVAVLGFVAGFALAGVRALEGVLGP